MCEKEAPPRGGDQVVILCGQQTAVGDAVGLLQLLELDAFDIALAVRIQRMVVSFPRVASYSAGLSALPWNTPRVRRGGNRYAAPGLA